MAADSPAKSKSRRADLSFYDLVLRPDPSRTVLTPFEPGYPTGFGDGASRTQEVVDQIAALHEAELTRQLEGVTASLDEHHRDVDSLLRNRFGELAEHNRDFDRFDDARQRLIGAYFLQEYAYEAAALFNPSIVLHPDQSNLPAGTVRFVISLRGVGEGHVSSVTFRVGTWAPGGALTIDDLSGVSVTPTVENLGDDEAGLAHLSCAASEAISETVLVPLRMGPLRGIEDVRLVRFEDDDGTIAYHGTFTGLTGTEARSGLISGDFSSFDMRAMTGNASAGKGMALFPRRISGSYAMLGRQDNKNIWLMYSNDILHWEGGLKIITPRYPWEFVQMGNCGSPIELAEGWLVLTHGVGTVRNYCIGACLLDKDDPSKLLARTARPVLAPSPKERDGYVPNVVYSCGAMVQGRSMLLPYAVADTFTAFATLSIDDLLGVME